MGNPPDPHRPDPRRWHPRRRQLHRRLSLRGRPSLPRARRRPGSRRVRGREGGCDVGRDRADHGRPESAAGDHPWPRDPHASTASSTHRDCRLRRTCPIHHHGAFHDRRRETLARRLRCPRRARSACRARQDPSFPGRQLTEITGPDRAVPVHDLGRRTRLTAGRSHQGRIRRRLVNTTHTV